MSTQVVPRRADTPWLTWALALANLLAFALCGVRAGAGQFMQWPGTVLVELGANVGPFTQFASEWETLCTCIFLHGGLLHLVFNVVALFQVGPFVERTVGRARFTVLYVVAGIAASACSMLAANYGYLHAGIGVGASGAICGLIGGSAVLGFRIEGRRSPLARSMLRWLGITVAFGYVISLGGRVHVDNYAHVGGALTGGFCALLFRRSVQYTPFGRSVRVAAGVLVCLASFVVHVGRTQTQPALARARLDYALGRCDALQLALRDAHVAFADETEIMRRCGAP